MKFFLVLVSLISCFSINAQLPKGDRIMAWQVDMTENDNYDSAFAYAQTGCVESVHLAFTWSGIEPDAGTFDSEYIGNTLDIINIYYPAYGTSVELQLSVTNTTTREVPADLEATNFDSSEMINRFKTLLDTVFAHIPNLELSALNIGNETDILFGTDSDLYDRFSTFLDSVAPYAKELYADLHGTELLVGTTLTHSGLTEPETKDLCMGLNANRDIIAVTYYPLESDFKMKPPSVVEDDFGLIVSTYSEFEQPIYFVECGYASSSVCESSEILQAQFYSNVFAAWDTYYDEIKYLTIFKSTDWSHATVEELGEYYELSDPVFLEYLRTLGVRTWEGDGESKIAYDYILCELEKRGWCSVECPLLSIDEQSTNNLTVFPNPSNGAFYVKNGNTAVKSVSIYSIAGELILQTSTGFIDISNAPQGIYFVQAEFQNGDVLTEKIAIQ